MTDYHDAYPYLSVLVCTCINCKDQGAILTSKQCWTSNEMEDSHELCVIFCIDEAAVDRMLSL
ncbi:hypothetical protein BofuT4_P161800.1 [Botrytis cinerea T4]|uniref:Uncharacterized protein n=1 Tax=Botryotinia fuckeliana (strain T4) TaxID=999810 RepID=G2YSY7_BOTF4|nr:hypothetical protein BofuT4_P161800.1 [Botrytis cinerea T4]